MPQVVKKSNFLDFDLGPEIFEVNGHDLKSMEKYLIVKLFYAEL